MERSFRLGQKKNEKKRKGKTRKTEEKLLANSFVSDGSSTLDWPVPVHVAHVVSLIFNPDDQKANLFTPWHGSTTDALLHTAKQTRVY